jgi:hypothetical protein
MPRRIDRALIGALAVSLVGHVAVIVGPAWQLPDEGDEQRTRIEARLAPQLDAVAAEPAAQASLAPATPAAAPKPRPRPKPRRKPAPATPAAPAATLGTAPPAEAPFAADPAGAPAAVADATPSGSESASADGAGNGATGDAVSDSQPSAQAAGVSEGASNGVAADGNVALPHTARIAFSLILGALPVGEALQTWQRDEQGYRLRIVMETTGAARLFKTLTVTQTSAGELHAGGLRPQSFIYEQTGRATANSTFDWAQMKLTLEQGDNRREFALDPGAQDLLSLAYQLGFAHEARQTSVSVASGKNYNRHTLEWIGEETVTTPAGEVRAVHVRTTSGEQTTEIWVAPQLHNLPVRIMFTDRKGTATQLIAHDVEADGKSLLRRGDSTEKK